MWRSPRRSASSTKIRRNARPSHGNMEYFYNIRNRKIPTIMPRPVGRQVGSAHTCALCYDMARVGVLFSFTGCRCAQSTHWRTTLERATDCLSLAQSNAKLQLLIELAKHSHAASLELEASLRSVGLQKANKLCAVHLGT